MGVTRGRLFPSGLCLSAIPRVVWAWPDPLPTGLNGDGKIVQTLWWAELDRLHSMMRAHPPLASQFAYALYKIVSFRILVSQDTPSFLSLLGCVLTLIVGNTLSLYLTVVLLNEQ